MTAPDDDWGRVAEPGGDFVRPADLAGHLLIVFPIGYSPYFPTKFSADNPNKRADAVHADVIDLDALDDNGNPGRVYRNTAFFQGQIIGAFKNVIGKRLLGRFNLGVPKNGMNKPWVFDNAVDQPDALQRAIQWREANGGYTPSVFVARADLPEPARPQQQQQQRQGGGYQQQGGGYGGGQQQGYPQQQGYGQQRGGYQDAGYQDAGFGSGQQQGYSQQGGGYQQQGGGFAGQQGGGFAGQQGGGFSGGQQQGYPQQQGGGFNGGQQQGYPQQGGGFGGQSQAPRFPVQGADPNAYDDQSMLAQMRQQRQQREHDTRQYGDEPPF